MDDTAASFLHQLRTCDQFCHGVGITDEAIREFYKAMFKLYSRIGSTCDLEGVTQRLYQLADSPKMWTSGQERANSSSPATQQQTSYMTAMPRHQATHMTATPRHQATQILDGVGVQGRGTHRQGQSALI